MVTWESKKKSCSIKWSNQEIGLQNSSIFNANLEFRNISIKKYKDKNLTSNEKWLDENVRQQVARLLLHKGGEKGHRDGHVDGCQYHQPVPNALEKAVVREYETRSLQRRRLVFGQRRRVVRQQRLRNQKYTNSNIIFCSIWNAFIRNRTGVGLVEHPHARRTGSILSLMPLMFALDQSLAYKKLTLVFFCTRVLVQHVRS